MSGLTHAEMSSRGGKAKSAAKAEANRAKAAQFWSEVRAGTRPAPRRKKRRKTRKPNAGDVPRRGSDVGTSPLLGFSGSETTPDNEVER